MKKTVQLVCLLLAVLMLASLAACGSPAPGVSTSPATSGKASASPADATPEKSEPFTLNFFAYTGSGNVGQNDEAELATLSEAIKADTGIDVTFAVTSTTFADSMNVINTKLAAGDLDAWTTDNPSYFVNNKMVEPLNDLLAQYGQNMLDFYPDNLSWQLVTRDGERYGIPTMPNTRLSIVTWWRKDLSDKYNLPVPKNLEEYESAMLTIMANEPDMVGLSSALPQWIFGSSLGGGMPASIFTDDTNTELIPWFPIAYCSIYYDNNEHFNNWCKMLQRWYKNGVLNPECFTMPQEKFADLKNSGRLISASAGYAEFILTHATQENPTDPWMTLDAEWVILNDFTNENGSGLTWSYGGAPAGFIFIRNGCKNAKEIIQIFNWVGESYENFELARWGTEYLSYEKNDRGKLNRYFDAQGVGMYRGWIGYSSGFYGAETLEFTSDYVSDEYLKVVNNEVKDYWYPTTFMSIDHSDDVNENVGPTQGTLGEEYFVKMVTGQIDVDAGMAELKQKLDQAGAHKFMDELNAALKEQYPDGFTDWSNTQWK